MVLKVPQGLYSSLSLVLYTHKTLVPQRFLGVVECSTLSKKKKRGHQ